MKEGSLRNSIMRTHVSAYFSQISIIEYICDPKNVNISPGKKKTERRLGLSIKPEPKNRTDH